MVHFFKKKDKQEESEGKSTEQETGFFRKLQEGLSKTRSTITGRLDRLFLGKREVTGDLLEELEEILFTSDIGVAATQELIRSVQEEVARKELKDPQALKNSLRDRILSFLHVTPPEHPVPGPGDPLVIDIGKAHQLGGDLPGRVKTPVLPLPAHTLDFQGEDVPGIRRHGQHFNFW